MKQKSHSTNRKKGILPMFGWLFKRERLDLEPALSSTESIENQLTLSTKTFEKEFLQVLSTLEILQETSEQLSHESSVMLELSQNETNPVNSASKKLGPNLSFIESSAHKLKSLLSILETNSKRINTTLSFENQLNNTFSQLTYIRTLFAVEAAPLEQSAKVMFTSLVEEIHRLQKDVTDIFANNFQALRKNRSAINSLIKSLQVQTTDQITVHAESQKKVNIAVQTQNQILSQDIDKNSNYKARSEAISQSIGNAIISLQTQDIVSQKIHHMFEVSEEMKLRYSKSKTIKNKGDRCGELRFIEKAALVILNQIEAIKSELQSADISIEKNLNSIADSINLMDTKAIDSTTLKSTEGDKGKSLVQALGAVGEMIQAAENFLIYAFKIVEPIRGQATNVSSTIIKLSSQLHLIGLNAEIHAAQIGGSTALETLSAKTSEISVETRELCRRISVQLDELAEALNENVNNLEALHEEATQANGIIQQVIPEEEQNLDIQETLYSDAQEKAKRLMIQLRSLINAQDHRTTFRETMIEELVSMQNLHREISRLAHNAAEKLKTEVDVPELMSDMLSRYTMNSEKAIHLQTLGIEDHSLQKNQKSPFPSARQDIDLFDLDLDQDSHAEPGPKKKKNLSTIESLNPADKLGINVELF